MGIFELTDIKFKWATTAGRVALLISTKVIRKQIIGETRWEAERRTNIGFWKNDGVSPSGKKVVLTY